MRLLIALIILLNVACAKPQADQPASVPWPDPATAHFAPLSDAHCADLSAFHHYQDRNVFFEYQGNRYILSPHGSFALNINNERLSVLGQIFKVDRCTFLIGINGGTLFSAYDENGNKI